MDCVQRVRSRRGAPRRIGEVTMVVAVLGAGVGCVDGLLDARIRGNEASAQASLRTIASAQMVTAMDCNGRYKPSLTALGTTGHLSPDLGVADTIEKAGYVITMTASDDAAAEANDVTPACKGTVTAFKATAIPIEPGKTGARFFITDEKGELKQATRASFEDATPVR